MRYAFILILIVLGSTPASADIYRYVNEDGVECYTDSPPDRNAVMVMKDVKPSRQSMKRPPPTRHLEAAVKVAIAGTEQNERILPVMGKITSTTGLRHDPFDGKLRHHNGVDIAIPQGTPVKPVSGGVITFSGSRLGYGNMVIVEHSDGIFTLYAHNSINLVHEGDQVNKTVNIALTGSTGRSTGPHLHFEAWQNGTNITSTFMPSDISTDNALPVVRHAAQIRRTVLANGTIHFTNLD